MGKKVKLSLREEEGFNQGIVRLFQSLHKESARLVMLRSHQHISVHELRKNIKKIRGALRLVRHEIGEKAYKDLNSYYREIAASVAVLRDDTSQIELLEAMNDTVKSSTIRKSIRKAIHQVRKKRKEEFRNFYAKNKQQSINQLLKSKIPVYDQLLITGDPDYFIQKSLKKVYKTARHSLSSVTKKGDSEAYHSLRKQVKYLMYHLSILRNFLSEPQKQYIEHLDKLSDYLGNLHDLDLFHDHIKDKKLIKLDKTHSQSMLKYIYRRRSYLKKKILVSGNDLFKESSKKFAQQIHQAWSEEPLGQLTRVDAK